MYSVVLMMALTGGAELPQSHGCRGGNGCYGGGYGGCYGGGCWGGGGCYGGGGHGCRGGGHGLFSRMRGGHGCHGSNGCYGGGYGGCYGGGGWGGGCYGGGGWGGGCYGGGYQAMPAGTGTPSKEAAPAPAPKTGFLAAPATIVVTLPVDAKLTIDDTATKATSGTRVFSSPVLEPGKDYFYTLKAEMIQDGKPVTASKRISVRAGEETRVNLELTESVASR